MLRLALCNVFLLALFTSMVYVTAIPQKRNYKDIILQEIDITDMGDALHKSSNFEVKESKGGKPKGYGTLKIIKDFPIGTMIQWKLLFLKDDNQMEKQAEGKRATLCDFLVKEKAMADMLLKYSNVTSCSIKKGDYTFRNCDANMDVFPPKIPENRDSWILDLFVSERKRTMFSMRATARVKRD